MGCSNSCPERKKKGKEVKTAAIVEKELTPEERWRVEPQRALDHFLENSGEAEFFKADSFDYFTDDTFVELRTLLDEPLGRSHFLAHVKSYFPAQRGLVKLWMRLHEYHTLVGNAEAQSKSVKTIYKKYFHISSAAKAAAEAYRKQNQDQCKSDTPNMTSYHRLLVPVICRSFSDVIVALIIHMRPTVEQAVLEAIERLEASQEAHYNRPLSSSIGDFVDIAPFGGIGVSDRVKPKLVANEDLPKESSTHRPSSSSQTPEPQTTASLHQGVLEPKLFLELQNEVFKEMRDLFLHFRECTEDFEAYKREKRRAYNRVEPADFIYYDTLGKGGFGQVVWVKKKSTGMHFAMKIQAKDTLLNTWGSTTIRHVEIERDVLVAHQDNPFIVSLRYAFQTPRYAFLCLDLAEGGSIRKVLDAAPCNRLPLEQVRLYTAEIVVALEALHDHNILYRDLKPENVLLRRDGHILLADMGLAGFYYSDSQPVYDDGEDDDEIRYIREQAGSFAALETSPVQEVSERERAISVDGAFPINARRQPLLSSEGKSIHTLESHSSSTQFSSTNVGHDYHPVTATEGEESSAKDAGLDAENDTPEETVTHKTGLKRSFSIENYEPHDSICSKCPLASVCGKPERRNVEHITGCGTPFYRPPEMICNDYYNEGVDWFMLGVFTYECLVGKLPFEPRHNEHDDGTEEAELRLLRRKARMPTFLDSDTVSLLEGLLDLNAETRLGVGPNSIYRSFQCLKGHPFFARIFGPDAQQCAWDKIIAMETQPLYVPEPYNFEETTQFSSFEALVKHWRKEARREVKVRAKRRQAKANYKIRILTEGNFPPHDTEHLFDNWDYIDAESINLEKAANRKGSDAAMRKSFRKEIGDSIRRIATLR